MRCRLAKKIRKAAVAYAGGNPHRHRFSTVVAAMRRTHWSRLGVRESWSYVYGCCARYAARARFRDG